jgi:hypothetical protein
VITISSLKGEGLDLWCNWLVDKVTEKKKNIKNKMEALKTVTS